MSKKIYNVMFHTHTISGIIISAALYVIFFAGSLSFLRDEIIAWERNEPVSEDYFKQVDFDTLFKNIENNYPLDKRNVTITHRIEGQQAFVMLSPSKDTLANSLKEKKSNYFSANLSNKKIQEYKDVYSLGEFFYRLHFFAQLNFFGISGYLLAGLVSFFFLFAIITGVVVHWKKIISSFYVFRPKQKLKTIWTDAHVALGFIGLPYQFLFAVTGCYLIIGYTVMLPPVQFMMYGENTEAYNEAIKVSKETDYMYSGKMLSTGFSINNWVEKAQQKWPESTLNALQVYNYGDENMHVKISAVPKYKDKLLGGGHVTYRVSDAVIVNEESPYKKTSYLNGVIDTIKRLHFGDYGGYGMKLIYFILGIITCFVIISGVLIWLVAREKKNVPEYKRKFNNWLVNIYMAICLSMYPITAFVFVVVKFFGNDFDGDRKVFIYQVFFFGWLLLSTIFVIKKDYYFTNKACLFLGSIIGVMVPVSNGIVTGNWPWVSWQNGWSQIFVLDVFWLLLSTTTIVVFFKLKPKK